MRILKRKQEREDVRYKPITETKPLQLTEKQTRLKALDCQYLL
jgi:hypothetical protein